MSAEEPKPRESGVSTVRQSDIEPYTALKWVGRLFKAASVFLAVALAGEFVAGIRMQGTAVLPMLMGELARTAVLAVVLWGGGDLVRLLAQLGNDIRAQRILLSRLVYRTAPRPSGEDDAAPQVSPMDTATLLTTNDPKEDEAARKSLES